MNALDVLKWAAILGGAVILGLHFAVYNNADRLTTRPRPWRIFICGNSVLTLYAMYALWSELNGITIYLVSVAMFVTLCGIFFLNQTYRVQNGNKSSNTRSHHG